jgi:hypothetical protein
MPYSHGVRFEPEVPFVNLRSRLTSTAHIKQLVIHHGPCEQWSRMPAFASPPVLRRGRAGALLDVSTRRLQNYEIFRKLARSFRVTRAETFDPQMDRWVVSLQGSGGYRDRTGDIQLAKLALSQLS